MTLKGCILVDLPGNKEKVYFEKRTGKVLDINGQKLPYQKRWLKKIENYASQKADDYGQSINDHLYDHVRKALEKAKSSETERQTKSSTKTKKRFIFW